jgi:hypothetical protein
MIQPTAALASNSTKSVAVALITPLTVITSRDQPLVGPSSTGGK